MLCVLIRIASVRGLIGKKYKSTGLKREEYACELANNAKFNQTCT